MIASPLTPIKLSATTDSLEEGAEVFEMSITPNAAYTIVTPSKATVYITDVVSMVPPPPSASFSTFPAYR